MNLKNKNELEMLVITPNVVNRLEKEILKDITKEWVKNCPSCGVEQKYTTKYVRNDAIKRNVWCNKCRSIERRIKIPKNGWSKLCPRCGDEQPYSCKSIFTKSVKDNRMCVNCTIEKSKKHRGKFERMCKCGKSLKYSCRQSLNIAKKRQSMCRCCATKESAKHIDRSFQKTDEYRKKMSESCKGKRHTEESKEKLRIAKLNQIKNQGIQRTYNPNACKFIDEYGRKVGYNFQHALNGGEIVVSGYSLDGYDKDKNVVFEYDEPKHNNFSMKKKDEIRQKRIIEKIKPIMFIRFNEQYNRLYDIISEKELM